ncbi:MAG: triose-phosphate isomerase [Patescibacteria group bacterium]|nr:MAG: triose-phosphate isomerase [Patescibacteria group bacterium]
MAKKKIIIGNWKMAPKEAREARRVFGAIKKTAGGLRGVQTVVCPPYIYISELIRQVSGHRCVMGAQDCFWSEEQAHTGEISASMLANMGVRYVIVGHSERRALGETNEEVAKKVAAVLKAGLTAVLCVGESERDEHGNYTAFIKTQIQESLSSMRKSSLENIIIAYEPIWAIGKSAQRAASVEDAIEVSILIKKVLSDMFHTEGAMNVPILYGGSVNPHNAEGFLGGGGIDGLLVGRASLDAPAFSEILIIASQA